MGNYHTLALLKENNCVFEAVLTVWFKSGSHVIEYDEAA